MTRTQQKIKRMHSVVRIKKQEVDNAALVLSATRRKKVATLENLTLTQKSYLQGIERLNQERASMDRDKLEPLEQGLDKTKRKWMELYNEILQIEKQEKLEEGILAAAMNKLQAIDKLEEKYILQFRTEIQKADQKNLDEIAIRRFREGDHK